MPFVTSQSPIPRSFCDNHTTKTKSWSQYKERLDGSRFCEIYKQTKDALLFENTGKVNLIKAETITIKAPKRGEEMWYTYTIKKEK